MAAHDDVDPLSRTVSEVPAPLPRLLHYRLLGLIGVGGMGAVYMAEDERLGRRVAIKRVAGVVDAASRRRLLLEARAASKLSHPNIVTVHAVEDADDGTFVVMEYLEGESLDARLARGRLTPEEIVRVGAEVADALACAHAAGFIHRDVKPANLFVTRRGAIKVLDFGVVKEQDAIGPTLTGTGVVVGTWPYMSPEQLGAQPLDGRSDVFALGAVLYEAAVGRRAFPGEDVLSLVRQITVDPVPLPRALVPDLPPALEAVIVRALAKDRSARFESAAALRDALTSCDLRARDVAASDAAATAPSRRASPTTIAVLTFRDLSPTKDQGYLCDGIAEEVVTSLARVEGVRVAARSISRAVSASDLDARAAGKKLEVEVVLEGAVRLAGSMLRVTAQLVDVASGHQRWSHRFDGALADVFASQDEIAAAIATTIRGIAAGDGASFLQRPATSPEAYERFLRARQLYRSQNWHGLTSALAELRAAIDIDPSYAPAYALVAAVYAYQVDWYGGGEREAEEAERASRRAVELGPMLDETHVARGSVLGMRREYAAAARALDEALRLNPQSFDALYTYGRICFQQGDHARTVDLFRRAADIQRDDFQALLLAALPLQRLGRDAEAVATIHEGVARLERVLSLDPHNARALALAAPTMARLGRRERALELCRVGAAMWPDDTSITVNGACAYAVLGEKEAALAALETAFGRGFGKRDWIEHDPDYDSIREEPRFRALLAKLR